MWNNEAVSDRKNYNDQGYSCPRDWRPSASWRPNWGFPRNPSKHRIIMVPRVLREGGSFNWVPNVSKGVSKVEVNFSSCGNICVWKFQQRTAGRKWLEMQTSAKPKPRQGLLIPSSVHCTSWGPWTSQTSWQYSTESYIHQSPIMSKNGGFFLSSTRWQNIPSPASRNRVQAVRWCNYWAVLFINRKLRCLTIILVAPIVACNVILKLLQFVWVCAFLLYVHCTVLLL